MIDFLTIILLIFGVLQIILFFKVWEMTNAIKEIRNKYLKDEDEKRRQIAEYAPSPKISGVVKTTIYPELFPGFFFPYSQVVQMLCNYHKKKMLTSYQ